MDQLGLLIGVGIAAAAGEGRPWWSEVPLLCPGFFGARLQGINSSKSLIVKGLMVDAQGIEPWTSPV